MYFRLEDKATRFWAQKKRRGRCWIWRRNGDVKHKHNFRSEHAYVGVYIYTHTYMLVYKDIQSTYVELDIIYLCGYGIQILQSNNIPKRSFFI